MGYLFDIKKRAIRVRADRLDHNNVEISYDGEVKGSVTKLGPRQFIAKVFGASTEEVAFETETNKRNTAVELVVQKILNGV